MVDRIGMMGSQQRGLLIAVFIALTSGLVSEDCGWRPALEFKRTSASGGVASSIRAADQPLEFLRGEALPPIILRVVKRPLGSQRIAGSTLYSDLTDATVSAAVRPTNVLMGGAAVEVSAGEARFDGLSIEEDLPRNTTTNSTARAHLEFTMVIEGTVFTISTGQLSQLGTTEGGVPSSAALMHYGFLRDGLAREVPQSTPFPSSFVVIRDRIGRVAVGEDARATVSLGSGNGLLTSAGPFVGRGIIEIVNLAFVPAGTGNESAAISLRFEVESVSGSFKASFDSEQLTLLRPGVANRAVEFDPVRSFIKRDNIGSTAVVNVAMPAVVIRLLTSEWVPDPTNTGLVVEASTDQGFLVGSRALVVRGVATFSDLTFMQVAPRSSVIKFRVVTAEGGVLELWSGVMTVAENVIWAKHAEFDPLSPVTTQGLNVRTTSLSSINLPVTIVRMKSSAYGVDDAASHVPLSLTIEPPSLGTVATGNATSVQNGVGAFRRATFVPSAEAQQLLRQGPVVVRLRVESTPPGVRDTIVSGPVTVTLVGATDTTSRSPSGMLRAVRLCAGAAVGTCSLSVSFDDEFTTFSSWLYEAEQALYATVGVSLGVVRLLLRDSFGTIRNPNGELRAEMPQIVAFTGADPLREAALATDNGANVATVGPDGKYTFACLQFINAPAGLVRLSFAAVHNVHGVLTTVAVRSGFVSLAVAATADFELRFRSLGSSIERPGQAITAVVGVTLPPVVLEVANSLGEVDEAAGESSITVVASTPTAGVLDGDGTVARVVDGVAIFDRLRYVMLVDNSVLRFTAESSSVVPVLGQQLRSGAVTVTQEPIPVASVRLADVGFVTWPTGVVSLGLGAQAAQFNNVSDVDIGVALIFSDSAHRPSSAEALRDAGVVVEVTSAEVAGVTARRTVDPSCSCVRFRHRTWSGFNADVEDGIATLRYTVVAATNARLVGATAVVGPITIVESQRSSQCAGAGSVSSPVVVGEFEIPADQFGNPAEQAALASRLAQFMSVDADRVLLRHQAAEPVARVDPATLASWSGVKVPMTFGNPAQGALNRKSAAALADEFVSLRGDCVTPALRLRSAYYERDDRSCDMTTFASEDQTAQSCLSEGNKDRCACYSETLFLGAGPVCVEHPDAQDVLRRLCLEMNTCKNARITAVCDLIDFPARNLTGLYVSSAALFVVSVAGVFNYYKRKRRNAAQQAKLSRSMRSR